MLLLVELCALRSKVDFFATHKDVSFNNHLSICITIVYRHDCPTKVRYNSSRTRLPTVAPKFLYFLFVLLGTNRGNIVFLTSYIRLP